MVHGLVLLVTALAMGLCTKALIVAFGAYLLACVISVAAALWPPLSVDPAVEPAVRNVVNPDEPIDVQIYVSPTHALCSSHQKCHRVYNTSMPYNASLQQEAMLSIPRARVLKGTYLHVYVTPRIGPYAGALTDPSVAPADHPTYIASMTRSMLRRKQWSNLLKSAPVSNSTELQPAASRKSPELHIPGILTLGIVVDHTCYSPADIPHELHQYMIVTQDHTHHAPFVFLNDMWLTNDYYIPVHGSDSPVLNVSLQINALSLIKFRTLLHLKNVADQCKAMGMTDRELDVMRDLLRRNTPSVLLVMVLVAMVHLLFDALAFKNDVQHWKHSRTGTGISARSVVLSGVSQVVVLLYLMDNDTSYIVTGPHCIQTLIDLWKITKALRLRFERKRMFGRTWIVGISRRTATASELETNRLDVQATKWMSYALYPLGVAYAVYSLMYHVHRGWYSWLLSTMTGYLYAFGFVMMTPQLFINYRLKSVAHLPWKALMYKAFNTFIDDVFAFLIHMPMMHRMACFRDDVVFLIYLYQRWIYPVDYARTEGGDPLPPAPGTTDTEPGKAHTVRNTTAPRAAKTVLSTTDTGPQRSPEGSGMVESPVEAGGSDNQSVTDKGDDRLLNGGCEEMDNGGREEMDTGGCEEMHNGGCEEVHNGGREEMDDGGCEVVDGEGAAGATQGAPANMAGGVDGAQEEVVGRTRGARERCGAGFAKVGSADTAEGAQGNHSAGVIDAKGAAVVYDDGMWVPEAAEVHGPEAAEAHESKKDR